MGDGSGRESSKPFCIGKTIRYVIQYRLELVYLHSRNKRCSTSYQFFFAGGDIMKDLHKIITECLLDTRCPHFLLLLLLLHALPASKIFRGVIFEYYFSCTWDIAQDVFLYRKRHQVPNNQPHYYM